MNTNMNTSHRNHHELIIGYLAFSIVGRRERFGRHGYAGASIDATRTSFLFTNSWMPTLESSRP